MKWLSWVVFGKMVELEWINDPSWLGWGCCWIGSGPALIIYGRNVRPKTDPCA